MAIGRGKRVFLVAGVIRLGGERAERALHKHIETAGWVIVALIVARADHAEIGLKRGERIIRNLGFRGRNARDERGFSGVGESYQSDIGQQLQLQPEAPLLTGLTGLMLLRSLMCGSSEAGVSSPAAPAPRLPRRDTALSQIARGIARRAQG